MSDTVDLDPNEKPWLERIIGYQEQFIDSPMVTDTQTRDDLERLVSMLKAVQESKS